MSVKKEVEKLSQVYSSLLKEDVMPGDAQSVNPSTIDTMAPPALDAQNGFQQGDENIMGAMGGCSSCEEHDSQNREMAKSEVYKIYKNICDLQKALTASDCEIEAWMLSKITKAADYLVAVTNAIEYEEFEKLGTEVEDGMSEIGSPVVVKVRDMLAGEPMGVNEQVLKQIIFNIECLKESKKIRK